MSEFTVTYDSCIEAARLASSRGDRLGAEQALTAAITAASSPGAEAQLAAALIKLGELKRDAGTLAEAEELFGRAVEISEDVDGDNGICLAAALTNLAGIRAVRGGAEEAERYLTRALALSEQRLGSEHPDLVVLLNDLSRLYLKRSAFGLAEPLLHRLHAIKRQKGEDHAEVATVLASLASVRQALGDHDGAEHLWRRVLAIRERTLAPNHFAIATAVENLAETCSARGKVPEALRLFHRALAMREMTLGLSHPSLRTLRERIADLQLQGADEFTGEETIPFAAPPVAVRIPPVAATPTVEIPTPRPAARIAASEAAQEPVPQQAAPVARAVAAPVVPPVAYDQPAAPELEVPAWAQVPQGGALVAPARAPQPMSIILPAAGDFDDDETAEQGQDYAFAQTRLQRMTASLSAVLGQRQSHVVAAGALALVVVAAALASQPRGGSEDASLGRPVPVQQYVAGGAAALADSAAGPTDDPRARAAGPANDEEDASSAPAQPERRRDEVTSSPRTAAKSSAPATPASEPAPTRVPELPRSLPVVSSALLDSTMRAAQTRVSIGPSVEKPGFSTSLGAVDFSQRSTNQPAVVIGDIPRIPYPQTLRVKGREKSGEVLAEFSVDTLGKPIMSTLRIVRSDHELLTGAVYRAIPTMRFIPAMEGGRKTVGSVQIPFQFTIGKD